LNYFSLAFEGWSSVAGLFFVYEPNDDGAALGESGVAGVRGDIRISGHYIDGTGGILGYAWGPQMGAVVLDTSDGTFASDLNTLTLVLQHQIGHTIGLYHVCPVSGTKLMEPTYSSQVSGPQMDDILGAQFFYGDSYEGVNRNDQLQYATNLVPYGQSGIPSLMRVNTLSLDSTADVDYYIIVVSSNSMFYAQASSQGATYMMGTVNSGTNTCNSTLPYQNTLNVYDLQFALLNSNGVVQVLSNNGPMGGKESVSMELIANQVYYLKVWTTTSTPPSQFNSVQLYRLDLGTTAPCNC